MAWGEREILESREMWQRRHAWAAERLKVAKRERDKSRVTKWERRQKEARSKVALRDRQLREFKRPSFVTSAQLGFGFQWIWGNVGPIVHGADHYTAGRRAKNRAELIVEARSIHRFHASKRWGGMSYEALFADSGAFFLGNPISRLSAACAGFNSGLTSVCCPGSTGDRMTDRQFESVLWYKRNAHTAHIPAAYRAPRDLSKIEWRAHRDWPGQSTSCPGVMEIDYKRLRSRL